MRSGRADDFKESDDKPRAVVDEVEGRGRLDPVSVNFGGTSSTETRHTSNHFAAASSASTASLAAPRTLRASSQDKNFSSRN